MQSKYDRLTGRVWPKHSTHSNLAHFTDLFTASQYDEDGISFRLPDHTYAEQSHQY